MHISIVGLGKLGSPMAAVFASKGFSVVGTDRSTQMVDALTSGRAPVDEPDLQKLIHSNRERIQATTDLAAAVAGTEATFVIVPTPSDGTGRFSTAAIVDAVSGIGDALRRKPGYHLVVITSTVMPGATGGEIREALETHAGRRLGPTLGLCYSPEFIALGSVVRDMLRPDMVLIGESDEQAGEMLERIYAATCDNQPAVRRMSFVNAELTKLAVNTFVTTKISYANMLADLCDRLPGADVDVVTRALGADTRIGARYLKGATAYGGPCFPRDNVAFAAMARALGARADLAEATDAVNRYQVERVVGAVEARLPATGHAETAPIGVLGLAYKPDTAVIEESPGLAVAARLIRQGRHVIVHDPKALSAARAALGPTVETADTAADCVARASLVLVMTAWPEFARIPIEAFRRPGRRMTVIDCWRMTPTEVAAVADVLYLGQGSVAPSVSRVAAGARA